MELYEIIPVIVKILLGCSLGGLFLLLLFTGKIRFNGKEKGGRNLVITLGAGLVGTLVCSLVAGALLFENATVAINAELMPAGAFIFACLALCCFVPVLIALIKIIGLVLTRGHNA